MISLTEATLWVGWQPPRPASNSSKLPQSEYKHTVLVLWQSRSAPVCD